MECFPVLLRAYVIALAIFAFSNPTYIQAAKGKILFLFLWRIFYRVENVIPINDRFYSVFWRVISHIDFYNINILLKTTFVPLAKKGINRGSANGVPSYGNFKEDKFSYLNITSIGGDLVDHNTFCAFACLETPPCFSFNLAAFPDINGKFLCELLPSDKYNNSDKLVPSKFFHHYSIAVCEV